MIWPLGHGLIATGLSVADDGQGILILKAVPNHIVRPDWQSKSKIDPEEFDNLDGPQTALVFKDTGAIDRMIGSLETLRKEMSK